MDTVLDTAENGKESSKNRKEDIDHDHPQMINIQADNSNTIISRQNPSASNSPQDSSPKSVVTEKELVMESPNRSPKELVFPDLLDHTNSSPLDFSPQFTPVLQSPRVQASASARPSGYDPGRIPASIFSKPSTPREWSMASNESLFSIHVGNTSFSKDQFFMMYKSGELPKLDDFNFTSSTTLPRLSGTNSGEIKKMNFESGLGVNNKELVTPENKTTKAKDHVNNYSVGVGVSSYRPDGAYRSNRSFQFPALAGNEGGKTPFPIVDSRRHRGEQTFHPQPLNMQIMHHHEQSQSFETTPKYGIPNWLVCFSCCRRPCC